MGAVKISVLSGECDKIPGGNLATVAGSCATTAILSTTADLLRSWLRVARHQFSFMPAGCGAGV
jgi:hypothetical protein